MRNDAMPRTASPGPKNDHFAFTSYEVTLAVLLKVLHGLGHLRQASFY